MDISSATTLGTLQSAPVGGVTVLGGGVSSLLSRDKRYRITWRFSVARFLPDSGLASYDTAAAVREALPSLGLIPVSPISAVAGDPFVQFTVQTAVSSNLVTIADLIDAANRLPVLSHGIALRLALEVSEIEIRSNTLPTATVATLDAESRKRAFGDATRRDIVTAAGNVVGAVGGGIAGILKFALIVAGVVGIAYLVMERR